MCDCKAEDNMQKLLPCFYGKDFIYYYMKKLCKRCKTIKSIEEFYKNRNLLLGRADWCIVCTKKWKDENKEAIAKTAKIYKEKNKNKVKEYNKEYKKLHKNETQVYNAQYRKDNSEYISWLKKNNYYDNRESILARFKQRRQTNLEYYRAIDKKSDAKRKDKRSKYNKEWAKRPTSKIIKINAQNRRRAKYEETDITNEWLLNLKNSTSNCPLCGCKMIDDGYAENGKQLDHIILINTFGTHTMDNVRYICTHCNGGRPRKDNRDVPKEFIQKFKIKHKITESI